MIRTKKEYCGLACDELRLVPYLSGEWYACDRYRNKKGDPTLLFLRQLENRLIRCVACRKENG